MIRLLAVVLVGALMNACAANPWSAAFIPAEASAVYAPVERTTLELVEFEEATPERAQEGHVALGYASFAAEYSQAGEGALRSFAKEIGADRVAWGLRLLHTERDSSLRPVTEWSDTRYRGRAYNPTTGKFDGHRVNVDATTTTTRYEPVIDERAYYAFRAVFYRSGGGEAAR